MAFSDGDYAYDARRSAAPARCGGRRHRHGDLAPRRSALDLARLEPLAQDREATPIARARVPPRVRPHARSPRRDGETSSSLGFDRVLTSGQKGHRRRGRGAHRRARDRRARAHRDPPRLRHRGGQRRRPRRPDGRDPDPPRRLRRGRAILSTDKGQGHVRDRRPPPIPTAYGRASRERIVAHRCESDGVAELCIPLADDRRSRPPRAETAPPSSGVTPARPPRRSSDATTPSLFPNLSPEQVEEVRSAGASRARLRSTARPSSRRATPSSASTTSSPARSTSYLDEGCSDDDRPSAAFQHVAGRLHRRRRGPHRARLERRPASPTARRRSSSCASKTCAR